MDQGVGLIMLSGVMLIGSFLAGSIPIVMHLSEEKVHFVSVVGAGLLVGTALSVIIPEGMHTLLIAQMQKLPLKHSDHAGQATSSSLHANSNIARASSSDRDNGVGVIPPGYIPSPASPSYAGHGHDHGHSDNEMSTDAFSSVGIALVLGFLFMLLVDQYSRSGSPSRDLESSNYPSKRSFTATLGLVVHAAADGIALGAAATTSHADVEMIVFFAIMLHKAPAAFGLVTFLLHEGLDRQKVRKHLAIFSFAAPIAAIITYFGISQEGKEHSSTMHATAMAMLFSAGTFLYVATVHVLPEVTKDSQNGYSRKELLALVIGAILPLILTAGHHH